jgi:hypothetical protein
MAKMLSFQEFLLPLLFILIGEALDNKIRNIKELLMLQKFHFLV